MSKHTYEAFHIDKTNGVEANERPAVGGRGPHAERGGACTNPQATDGGFAALGGKGHGFRMVRLVVLAAPHLVQKTIHRDDTSASYEFVAVYFRQGGSFLQV